MDRQQFCNFLAARKDELGASWLDLTINTHIQQSSLHRIMYGDTNFYVITAIAVATSLKLLIIAKNSDRTWTISTPGELAEWLTYTRERSKMNISQFARAIGVSRNFISKYTSEQSKMRIDTFLKWAEVTGYTVELAVPPHPDIVQ